MGPSNQYVAAHDAFLECPMTYLEYFYGAVYLCLNIFTATELYHSFTHRSQKIQKGFLLCVWFQTLIRVIYFFSAPIAFDAEECSRGWEYAPSIVWEVLGSYPLAFYVSSFSLLVYSFANVYHATLHGIANNQQAWWLILCKFLLIVLNLVVHVSYFVFYTFWSLHKATTNSNIKHLETVWRVTHQIEAGMTLGIGLGFALFGSLLVSKYLAVDHKTPKVEVHASPTVSSYSGSESESEQTKKFLLERRRHRVSLSNPMSKIVVTTATVTICFTLRAILFFAEINIYTDPYIRAGYFLAVEVIPLFLMLYIFHTTKTKNFQDTERLKVDVMQYTTKDGYSSQRS